MDKWDMRAEGATYYYLRSFDDGYAKEWLRSEHLPGEMEEIKEWVESRKEQMDAMERSLGMARAAWLIGAYRFGGNEDHRILQQLMGMVEKVGRAEAEWSKWAAGKRKSGMQVYLAQDEA